MIPWLMLSRSAPPECNLTHPHPASSGAALGGETRLPDIQSEPVARTSLSAIGITRDASCVT